MNHLLCISFCNQALRRMKAEWKDIEFVFVQYKDTGISILSAVDDLQVRLNAWLFVLPLQKGKDNLPVDRDWEKAFLPSYWLQNSNRTIGHCASVSKRGLAQNLSYENDFDLHENEPVGGTHFHMNGFAWNSFWNRGKRQLGNSLLFRSTVTSYTGLPGRVRHNWSILR